MRSVLIAILLLCVSAGASQADYRSSKTWFNEMSYQERIRTQFLLVFTGDYASIVDGAFGKLTYNALTSFQEHREYTPDGVLDAAEMLVLQRDGLDLVKRVGFETKNDASTGITLGVPVKLFEEPGPSKRGQRWQAYDNSIELETLSVASSETAYKDLYKRLTRNGRDRKVDTKLLRNDYFAVSGTQDGRDFYVRIMKTSGDSRGFSLSWDPKHAVFMDRVAVAMSNSLRFYEGGPDTGKLDAMTSAPDLNSGGRDPEKAVRITGKSDRGRKMPAGSSSGSGYLVTAAGHIGTNAHVVSECSFLEVAGHGTASLVQADLVNDLAIIQLDNKHAEHFAQFRAEQPIVRGEEVFVLGYPFAQLLDNNLNFTYGIVSSLAGVRGDIRHFMVSAPVQPGNSGGPVLDRTGAVIGTVVSRLDKFKTLQVAGDLPENINFAIRGRLMSTFMESLGLAPAYNTITRLKSPTVIDEEAALYTVQILCKN
ncbi:serine protease [Roseibium sediminicola]|uniref:Serine protease n=1 Tax=Roseibium sediminicola TaxID=2933272 RepID=A0ABT0GUH2_9HYPH|nr:serine protease [Roseibium sp. CAU 1639]MCK7612885.1 serine protease [Roseibium sp. CAU 1639]